MTILPDRYVNLVHGRGRMHRNGATDPISGGQGETTSIDSDCNLRVTVA